MSLSRILRRTAVSPKIQRMSSSPMPRTSSRFISKSGQRPSMVSWLMRNRSTASSATSPLPREISSRPSSLLPSPRYSSLRRCFCLKIPYETDGTPVLWGADMTFTPIGVGLPAYLPFGSNILIPSDTPAMSNMPRASVVASSVWPGSP